MPTPTHWAARAHATVDTCSTMSSLRLLCEGSQPHAQARTHTQRYEYL